MELCSEEAVKFVWEGAIPLQIHLHESEVTTLPPPPPALVLGSRIRYLPLLVPLIKPHFSSTLPPGNDTVWFDYNGLPLKWYMPIGVLFDLLCAEPERPWNLTVHFRGYPGEVLTPCESQDNVKWSYINSLKEAACVINGNCKSIMNMSQADQFDLWQSLVKGNMEGYLRISSRLKLGPVGEDCAMIKAQTRQAADEPDSVGSIRPSRIPIRLYIRIVGDLDYLEDAPAIDSWDRISYINRTIEIQKEGDSYMTLKHAMRSLLPEFFDFEPSTVIHEFSGEEGYHEVTSKSGDTEIIGDRGNSGVEDTFCRNQQSEKAMLIRIQGIEPDMEIPFSWIVNNLKNPEYFLHICVFVKTLFQQDKTR